MPDVKRTVKIITEQRVIDKPSGVEGFPLRQWSIQIVLLNHDGEEVPATVFEKATYKLHPSFEKRATQVIKRPPFRIDEEGWGEFDMDIFLTVIDKGGDHQVAHDLNFQAERYEAKHVLVRLRHYKLRSIDTNKILRYGYQTFKNPKPNLLAALKESGPTLGDENGVKPKRESESARKKKKVEKGIDMEKLADNLQRLGEDDLLQVVSMVHENKTADTYTKNDVEQGEFHVDLYTLPDNLVRMLWDFSQAKVPA